jgi:hypothetical protein
MFYQLQELVKDIKWEVVEWFYEFFKVTNSMARAFLQKLIVTQHVETFSAVKKHEG